MTSKEYKSSEVGEPENDLHAGRSRHESREEQVVYCEEVYEEDPETMVQLNQPAEVPCYVMNNSFYSEQNMAAVNRDHSTCHICGDDLTNKRFYNHLFDFHGFTKQQCEILKQQKRLESFKNRPTNGRKATKVHGCGGCGLEFVTRTGLTSHLGKSPGCSMQEETTDGKKPVNNIVCPSFGCEKAVSTYLDLAIHVDTYHRDLSQVGDSYRIRRVTFPDKISFLRWKRKMEKDTCSEFFLRTSQKVNFAVRTFLYKCLFSNSRGQTNGRKCEQCPAFVKACERNHGQYEVVACFGHLGHEHPTETDVARQMRIEKCKLYDNYQEEQMQQQKHIIMDGYRPTTHQDGVMILMPVNGQEIDEEESVEEEHDAFRHVVVDDADDEIVGPAEKQTCQDEYLAEPPQLQPSSSHHY